MATNKIKEFKNLLSSMIKPYDDFTIMLSGGIDSRSIFFESLEQSKKFNCCTFRMEDIYSTDFKESKILCDKYNIELIEVVLPNDLDILIQDVHYLKLIGCKSKTDFECVWPFLYAYKKSKNMVISGMGADGHFCLSKKGMIHYRKNRIDEFRLKYFNNPNAGQKLLHKKLHNNHFMPFLDKEMVELFLGTKWDDINKPREKQLIVDAYKKYFKDLKIYRHINLQKGDSQISNHFNTLLNSRLNTKNFKSVISIYNRLPKETLLFNEQ